jgi:hypothetical protein
VKPEHDHDDDTDPLPQRRRDALDAQHLVGLSQPPDYRLAKLAQGRRPGAAPVPI